MLFNAHSATEKSPESSNIISENRDYLVKSPKISSICKSYLNKRLSYIDTRERLKGMRKSNEILLKKKELPTSTISKLKETKTSINQELVFIDQKIINIEEKIILSGCPAIIY